MPRAKTTLPVSMKRDTANAHPASLTVVSVTQKARPTAKAVMALSLHHHPASVRANRHTKH